MKLIKDFYKKLKGDKLAFLNVVLIVIFFIGTIVVYAAGAATLPSAFTTAVGYSIVPGMITAHILYHISK